MWFYVVACCECGKCLQLADCVSIKLCLASELFIFQMLCYQSFWRVFFCCLSRTSSSSGWELSPILSFKPLNTNFPLFRTSSESNSDSEPELAADVSVNPGKMRGTLANSGGGKKKKRKKRQQKYVKSISAPSKIQSLQSGSKKTSDEHHAKENKSKVSVVGYFIHSCMYAHYQFACLSLDWNTTTDGLLDSTAYLPREGVEMTLSAPLKGTTSKCTEFLPH